MSHGGLFILQGRRKTELQRAYHHGHPGRMGSEQAKETKIKERDLFRGETLHLEGAEGSKAGWGVGRRRTGPQGRIVSEGRRCAGQGAGLNSGGAQRHTAQENQTQMVKGRTQPWVLAEGW